MIPKKVLLTKAAYGPDISWPYVTQHEHESVVGLEECIGQDVMWIVDRKNWIVIETSRMNVWWWLNWKEKWNERRRRSEYTRHLTFSAMVWPTHGRHRRAQTIICPGIHLLSFSPAFLMVGMGPPSQKLHQSASMDQNKLKWHPYFLFIDQHSG